MKTKILLGTIGAVAILILVSFTNVIGVESTTSNSINDSPLFSIRTKKAINQASKTVLTSDYLGKGLNAIQFPLRDNRTGLIQKAIEIIEKMDEKEFNLFQNLILSHFSKEKNIKNIDIINLLTLLKLRYIPKELEIKQFDMIGNKTKYPPTFAMYDETCLLTIGNWFPGCLLLILGMSVMVLFFVFNALIFTIVSSLYTMINYCPD
jgi:hypothetical protein